MIIKKRKEGKGSKARLQYNGTLVSACGFWARHARIHRTKRKEEKEGRAKGRKKREASMHLSTFLFPLRVRVRKGRDMMALERKKKINLLCESERAREKTRGVFVLREG